MLNKILKNKIIAIARGVNKKDILSLADALYNGGIDSIEVAIDHSSIDTIKDSIESIKILSDNVSTKMNIGAGTVVTIEDVLMAKNAGAKFIISPNVDIDVIKKTKELSLISMPGALTPSEVATAIKYGADTVKIFPAGSMGPGYIKNILAPIRNYKLMAVGGINLENAKGFMEAGCVGLGIGGNLVDKKQIATGDFSKITDIAKKYIEIIK